MSSVTVCMYVVMQFFHATGSEYAELGGNVELMVVNLYTAAKEKRCLTTLSCKLHHLFLPHDTMLAQCMLSSSVCPSATSRHCTKTAKRRITQTMP